MSDNTKKTGSIVDKKILFTILFLSIFIFIVIPLIFEEEEENSYSLSKKEIAGDNSNLKNSKEFLKLMFDDYTPCNIPINYKFELDTQGDPISLKFPGVDRIIYYSGKGTIKVPPRKPGNVEILSSNPNLKARVRIWKVIIGY